MPIIKYIYFNYKILIIKNKKEYYIYLTSK